MDFPVYRKYTNLDSYFVITSANTWTEYKRLGKKYIRYDFTAQQFPEKLFLQDLIHLTEGFAASSAGEISGLAL